MQSLTKKIAITIITGIIIIVFGAWGMGDLFSDGNKNTVSYTHLTLPTNREV